MHSFFSFTLKLDFQKIAILSTHYVEDTLSFLIESIPQSKEQADEIFNEELRNAESKKTNNESENNFVVTGSSPYPVSSSWTRSVFIFEILKKWKDKTMFNELDLREIDFVVKIVTLSFFFWCKPKKNLHIPKNWFLISPTGMRLQTYPCRLHLPLIDNTSSKVVRITRKSEAASIPHRFSISLFFTDIQLKSDFFNCILEFIQILFVVTVVGGAERNFKYLVCSNEQ